MPGLDGMRAIAVAAVVVFHLNSNWLPGGFLGVDIFFVVSGFLITQLLLRELRDTGRLSLGSFYIRRARRLLPAVAFLIGAVIVAGTLVWTDERPTLWPSVGASAAYGTNWWLILDHQSYFVASGRPPMLQHLWSLAIEEQYYLLWPVTVLAIVWWCRRRRRFSQARTRQLALVALALAGVSTGLMAFFAARYGVPYRSDSARVYYGGDTHAMGLLLGSAVGAWVVTNGDRSRRSPLLPAGSLDLLAVAGLLVVGWQLRHVTEFLPGLYRGGFLAFDAVVVLVVFVVSRRESWIGRQLDRPVPRWIGQRSYSIYLWHWPVVIVTRPGLDVHGPTWALIVLRVGLTLVLADLSYRLVERRFRSRQPDRAARPRRPARPSAAVVAGLTAAVLAIAAAFAVVAVPRRTSPSSAPAVTTTAAHPMPHARAAPARPATRAPSIGARPSTRPRSATAARSPAGPPPSGAPLRISAFGDSVLLGARPALQASGANVSVDAVEGIQAYQVLDAVNQARSGGQLGPVVLIHTGNNGVIDPGQLRTTLDRLRDRRVVLFNDRVPRDWESPNNHTIGRVGGRYANVRLVDWHALSGSHGGDWLYGDGIHLTPDGATAYAQLAVSAAGPG